jgi:hypothetical protein
LEYELPYGFDMQEIRITDDSEHRFVVLAGHILKTATSSSSLFTQRNPEQDVILRGSCLPW